MKNNIVNNCNNGKCSCCGQCCTDYIPWTKKEIIRVAEYLKEHPEIEEQYKNLSQDSFKCICAFNDEATHKCLIYPVRPSICRVFRCNKNVDEVAFNKDKHLRKAFVNCYNKSNPINNMGKLCSTHTLFFNNIDWDKRFIGLYCKEISKGNFWSFQKSCNLLLSYFNLMHVEDDKNNNVEEKEIK